MEHAPTTIGAPAADKESYSGDPGYGFQGTIGATLADSVPWWPPQVTAPAGAPNVVVVLLDDLGFSDFGCFGSEIETPAIDQLAALGLRFANYTTVPMCTPARAALLTGKNPHAVGCGWLTFNTPGYPGYRAGEISHDAPTMAELLRAAGYSTYAVGKWHNTAEYNITPSGNRASWPLQRGFDRFYGFIGGETHYFAPSQLFEDNAILERDDYPATYYCTDDFTDKAIDWIKAHVTATPAKPFFLYLPFNAPHAPLQAKPEDLTKYRGRYDRGWEVIRNERHARQRAMGIIGGDWKLPGNSAGVPAWSSLDRDQRAVMARYMELYAAIVDNIDQNLARLTLQLRALGLLDHTLVIITSDNGANGIGGPQGAANNLVKRLTRSETPQAALAMLKSGDLGGTRSWPAYPLGWTDVSTTPFRLYKTTTMNGGIRVPMVVHWPAGIAEAGAIRHQWVHVTDTLPTILDLVGISYPRRHNGYRTRTLDGSSYGQMLHAPQAPSTRTHQHYELGGNRGYRLGNWKIVSLQPPATRIDLDNWMLFNLESDPTELYDLAQTRPDKLAELAAAFDADAAANYVFPLDNRDIRRTLTVPPFLEHAYSAPRVFYPGLLTAALSIVSPLIADRDYRLECDFTFNGSDEGVIFAIGDPVAGMALFVRDRKASFVYNPGLGNVPVRRDLLLDQGGNHFLLDHRALGDRRGIGELYVNGNKVAADIDMSPTMILGWVGEGLDIGIDRKQKVTELYADRGSFAYTGIVSQVRIAPGAQAADSYANRPELQSQRD